MGCPAIVHDLPRRSKADVCFSSIWTSVLHLVWYVHWPSILIPFWTTTGPILTSNRRPLDVSRQMGCRIVLWKVSYWPIEYNYWIYFKSHHNIKSAMCKRNSAKKTITLKLLSEQRNCSIGWHSSECIEDSLIWVIRNCLESRNDSISSVSRVTAFFDAL